MKKLSAGLLKTKGNLFRVGLCVSVLDKADMSDPFNQILRTAVTAYTGFWSFGAFIDYKR